MKQRCGNCKKWFMLSARQKKRLRWPSSRPKDGLACSKHCGAMLAVKARKHVKHLPSRLLAYSRLQNAIDQGKLVRPENCSRCGGNPGRDRLGRSRIEGHHEDHNRPLDVVWLCDKCHKEISPRARGTRSAFSKLTETKVRRIRKWLLEGVRPQHISYHYRVTPKAITDIRDRKTWGWLL